MTRTNSSILLNKYILFIFLGFSMLSQAQMSLAEYKKAWPDFNEIILEESLVYNFSIQNKKLKVVQDNHYESMILSENGIQNNEESFTYSELVKLKSYDAYSVVSNNGKEKKIKVTQSNEKTARDNSVFYNDVKERQLIFPNLETGAKKVYDYQTEFLDPFLLQKFIFGNSLPIKNSTLEIHAEKDINVGFKIFNDPNNTIAFTKSEKKGKWIYKWTLTDVKPLKFESNSPGYLYIVPHIDVYIKDYTVDKTSVPVLDDTPKLFNYYKGFVKNLNKTESTELKAITLNLISGVTSDREKMKTIFYWVKDNIKYIAFENGYEGFIPREAGLVCERKFGDCKDMASIITSMAHYAGIKDVSVSWIGTRSIPYSYEQLSTPAVDNHMIAIFKDGNDYVFLDGTDKETRYGIPTAFIQGKEALYNNGETYKIIPVPVVSAEMNEIHEELALKIDNNKLIGAGNVEYHGFSRSNVLSQIGDAVNKTRFEMIKSLVLKGNNKFNLSDYKESNVKDRDQPYHIDFNFNLDNYIIKMGKEMYVNLYLDKAFEKLTIEKDRISKYEFDFLTYTNSTYKLELPANYTVKSLPAAFSMDNDYFKADFSHEISGNYVVLTMKLKHKKILLDNSDFEKWNESIRKLKSAYNETITLQEK
jgi:transglutaminase-like putative cysteine protease